MKISTTTPLLIALVCCSSACSDDKDPVDLPVVTPTSSTLTPTFTFESGPVRPLALSADGSRLFVANTPNATLDVLDVSADGLTLVSSTHVGLEPVAVAARANGEVWVVNHLSDSVSVVDTTTSPPRVVRTLLVGDEPQDIVFAGPEGRRAFISTAHRGQHRSDPSIANVPGAGDPLLTTPGIGRADVWVFDGDNLGDTLGGTPLRILSFFGDSPRGLAVSPDGARVYVAVFKSGNRTTVTPPTLPCAGFDGPGVTSTCVKLGIEVPGAPPGPATSHDGVPAPPVAVILKTGNDGVWRDVLGRDWTAAATFDLPDQDLFAIDTGNLATVATYAGLGTTLFNVAVNPVTGVVYVSNTEARNDLRFEGPGTYAATTLQGHLAESRITVVDGASVRPRHLNKHIAYDVLPAPTDTASHSLSTPLEVVVSPDGATLYVAGFGSAKVGVLSTAALENDSFDPRVASAGYLDVSGGGPSGVVLDSGRQRLYVATRFDNGVSVIDLATAKESGHRTLANPEPGVVTTGRPALYDGRLSSNGEAACASCHIFADDDHLAWDLGNPDGEVVISPVPVRLGLGAEPTINGTGEVDALHPMKGPLTTQTLRGLVNHGPMHWRGDRVSGAFGTDTSKAPPYDAELSFNNFIGAFQDLLGRAEPLPREAMQAFTAFTLSVVMPPNPVRALDNGLNASQERGRQFYLGCAGTPSVSGNVARCSPNEPIATGLGHFSDGLPIAGFGFTCQGCHTLDPAKGFFGTDGQSSFEALPQTFKIPQLRNMVHKVGMFGSPAVDHINLGDNGYQGAQVRGTGYAFDGSTDTLFRFLQQVVFNPTYDGRVGFTGGDPQRRDVEQYLLAFDTDLAPVVGQQVTLRADNAASVGPRIDLLVARAKTPFVSKVLGAGARECDLVARFVTEGRARTYKLQPDGFFEPDDGGSVLDDAEIRAIAAKPGQEVTYTCLPFGWASAAE